MTALDFVQVEMLHASVWSEPLLSADGTPLDREVEWNGVKTKTPALTTHYLHEGLASVPRADAERLIEIGAAKLPHTIIEQTFDRQADGKPKEIEGSAPKGVKRVVDPNKPDAPSLSAFA